MIKVKTLSEQVQLVYFVFVGQRNFWWQHLMQPGFAHCFALLQSRSVWLVVDSLVGRLVIEECASDRDLVGEYKQEGFTVLGPFVVDTRETKSRSWEMLVPITCVTVCRRLLGARAPQAITPWQLYQRLQPLELTALCAFK